MTSPVEIDPLVAAPIRKLSLEAAIPGSRVLYAEQEGEVMIVPSEELVISDDLPPVVCIAFDPERSLEAEEVIVEISGSHTPHDMSEGEWLRLTGLVAERLRDAWFPSAHRRLELSRARSSDDQSQ